MESIDFENRLNMIRQSTNTGFDSSGGSNSGSNVMGINRKYMFVFFGILILLFLMKPFFVMTSVPVESQEETQEPKPMKKRKGREKQSQVQESEEVKSLSYFKLLIWTAVLSVAFVFGYNKYIGQF